MSNGKTPSARSCRHNDAKLKTAVYNYMWGHCNHDAVWDAFERLRLRYDEEERCVIICHPDADTANWQVDTDTLIEGIMEALDLESEDEVCWQWQVLNEGRTGVRCSEGFSRYLFQLPGQSADEVWAEMKKEIEAGPGDPKPQGLSEVEVAWNGDVLLVKGHPSISEYIENHCDLQIKPREIVGAHDVTVQFTYHSIGECPGWALLDGRPYEELGLMYRAPVIPASSLTSAETELLADWKVHLHHYGYVLYFPQHLPYSQHLLEKFWPTINRNLPGKAWARQIMADNSPVTHFEQTLIEVL